MKYDIENNISIYIYVYVVYMMHMYGLYKLRSWKSTENNTRE